MKRRVSDLVLACFFGVAIALLLLDRQARADTNPAFDRDLVTRMVRALEDQARATNNLVQATERCKR